MEAVSENRQNGYLHRIPTDAVRTVARARVGSSDESRCVRRHALAGRSLLDREHTVRHEYLRGSQRPRPGDARECAIARRRRLRRYRFGIASRSSALGIRRLRRRSTSWTGGCRLSSRTWLLRHLGDIGHSHLATADSVKAAIGTDEQGVTPTGLSSVSVLVLVAAPASDARLTRRLIGFACCSGMWHSVRTRSTP